MHHASNVDGQRRVQANPVGAFHKVLLVDEEVLNARASVRSVALGKAGDHSYHRALDEGAADVRETVLDALERDLGDDVASHDLRDVVLWHRDPVSYPSNHTLPHDE